MSQTYAFAFAIVVSVWACNSVGSQAAPRKNDTARSELEQLQDEKSRRAVPGLSLSDVAVAKIAKVDGKDVLKLTSRKLEPRQGQRAVPQKDIVMWQNYTTFVDGKIEIRQRKVQVSALGLDIERHEAFN